ncbi:MAG: hypothetical protein BWY63_03810 [Chloroflexi bacterium ADurb.Bin360]|nr:MAG: hypothetical protein BWY63_03810 [Chloroflexi bacterium ADurb.Bin360]
MGMLETRQHRSLLPELFTQLAQQLRIQTWLGHQFLDRDRYIQAQIPCTIDRAHSALPQQRDDTIALLEQLTIS